MTSKAGRSPSGRATHERSQSALSPPPVGVPNAALKYEFVTPYYRGPDLVFDFVFAQPNHRFERKPWSFTAAYGYENARDTSIFAEAQYVGTAHSLSDRFTPLAPAYQRFMREVEDAATAWATEKRVADEAEEAQRDREDAALVERVLAASAMSAGTAATTKIGAGLQPASATAESRDAQGPSQ